MADKSYSREPPWRRCSEGDRHVVNWETIKN